MASVLEKAMTHAHRRGANGGVQSPLQMIYGGAYAGAHNAPPAGPLKMIYGFAGKKKRRRRRSRKASKYQPGVYDGYAGNGGKPDAPERPGSVLRRGRGFKRMRNAYAGACSGSTTGYGGHY